SRAPGAGRSTGVAQTLQIALPDAEATRDLGRRVAGRLRAGDLLVLTGELGAGKTTLTQGLGQALGVRGRVASPTFIIAREHQPGEGGVGLNHVDAYRLNRSEEHTSELQSRFDLVCRLLLEKKKETRNQYT